MNLKLSILIIFVLITYFLNQLFLEIRMMKAIVLGYLQILILKFIDMR